uniref:Luxuriosin-like protein n=1 Tax=Sitophilus zeamais TaxID=7047 RepID=B6RQP8_SITZE|nr:luxuriosin-like protein [Sitophilus zeamais]
MKCLMVVVFLAAVYGLGMGKVLEPGESEVTRKIHGSHGEYRDFTKADCASDFENKWVRCVGREGTFIYHWNDKLKGCERAIYKGCAPTRNNFITEHDCNTQAKPICSK